MARRNNKSGVSFAKLGGQTVGFVGAELGSKMVPFLNTGIGGVVKGGLGLVGSYYSENGSFMEGLSEGVMLSGIKTVGQKAGVISGFAEQGRLGPGAGARRKRLDATIRGMKDGRQQVYAKVA